MGQGAKAEGLKEDPETATGEKGSRYRKRKNRLQEKEGGEVPERH